MDPSKHLFDVGHVLQCQAGGRYVKRLWDKACREYRRIKNAIFDTKRIGRLLLLGVLDHAGRNVDSGHTCATPCHLTREITVATTNVEDAHAANLTAQRQLGRTEELISVVVASGCLTVRICAGRVVP